MSMNITCTLVIPGQPDEDIPLFQTDTSETYRILNAGRDWRVQAREFLRIVEDHWGPRAGYAADQSMRKYQRRIVGEAWAAAEKGKGKLVWGLV